MGSGARATLCGTTRSHGDLKRFRVWCFAVAAWRWSLARRVLSYVLIPWASCPSIPHVKALCLLAACMHACDYERKSQIFVADSIFFVHKGIVVQFYCFSFPLDVLRRCFACLQTILVSSFSFFRFVVGSRR